MMPFRSSQNASSRTSSKDDFDKSDTQDLKNFSTASSVAQVRESVIKGGLAVKNLVSAINYFSLQNNKRLDKDSKSLSSEVASWNPFEEGAVHSKSQSVSNDIFTAKFQEKAFTQIQMDRSKHLGIRITSI